MNKQQITLTQNTLKKLQHAIITKHLNLNKDLNVDEETIYIFRQIKTIVFYLDKIKKEV